MAKAPTLKTASKFGVGALKHDDANRASVPTAAWRFAMRCPSKIVCEGRNRGLDQSGEYRVIGIGSPTQRTRSRSSGAH